MAQALDFIVDGGVLLDIGIRMGNIGLRLVVIIIRDEVFHGIFREKLLELAAELGSQGLVVGQDQGGTIEPGDDICHGEGLARAGNTQQHLLIQAVFQAHHQIVDGLRLVPGRMIIGNKFKSVHKDLRSKLFIILYHVRSGNTR